MARFLKRIVGVGQLAGTHVHDAIEMALKQHADTGVWPDKLADRAVATYRGALVQSQRVAKALRADKSPDHVGAVLDLHLYGIEEEAHVEVGANTVRTCIDNLEASELLAVLKALPSSAWFPIATRIHEPVNFDVTPKLNMPAASGLRVYTAFDVAFMLDRRLHIIDWKTGRETDATRMTAREQLCAYALYGIWRGEKLEDIRVQSAWLASGPPEWRPTEIAKVEIEAIKGAIQDQNVLEKDLLERFTVGSGRRGGNETVAYRAARSSFPPTPSDKTCEWCKYRLICQEKHGKAAALVGAVTEAAN